MLTKRRIISMLRRNNLLPEDYNDKSQEELLEHMKNIDWQALHFAVEEVKKLIRTTHNPITGGTGSSDYWNAKIDYKSLNRNQKVKYTFYKISAALVDYGFECFKLNYDWMNANFIAVHIDGKTMLRIQQKGRFTIDHNYRDKNIYIAYIEDDKCKIYYHDDAYSFANHGQGNRTWLESGQNYVKTPKRYDSIITVL